MTTSPRTLLDLPEIDVFSAEFGRDPHPILDSARTRHALAQSERGLEVLSYDACQEVYRDPNLAVGQLEAFAATGITGGRFVETFVKNINNAEGTSHRRLRRAVAPFFTPSRAERMRIETRRLIDAWLGDAAEAGECDLMEAMARRLPSTVFCAVVGAPLEDQGRVARLSESMTKFFLRDAQYRDEILAAFDEVSDYASELLEWRSRVPADDFVSVLVDAERRGDLDRDDSITMIITFMTASTDTTSAQLGLSLIALDENKDQWEVLKRHPEHVPSAVVELARYKPGVWATARTAREAGTFMDVRLEPGTGVFSNVISANRDPEVYERPAQLDVTRKLARPPLTWGLGHHFCVGRGLAVMELEEALRAILEQWSDFELVGDPQLVGMPYLVSPQRLPIRFALRGNGSRRGKVAGATSTPQ